MWQYVNSKNVSSICFLVAMELYADEGANVTFDLPSVAKCGNFKFLNPQLYPLMVIKNQSAAAIEEAYVKRTTVYVVNNKLVLTLKNVTPKDRGKYRIYTKTGDITTCSAIHHYLNVKGIEPRQENLLVYIRQITHIKTFRSAIKLFAC